MPYKSDAQRKAVWANKRDPKKEKRDSFHRSKEERKRLVAQQKYGVVMREYYDGELTDGKGNIVTDESQAKAIAYSEARKKDSNYGRKTQSYHSLGSHIHGKKENQKEIELKKGIKVEREHSNTIRRIRKEKLSNRKAEEAIARDHIKEDPHYYEKLDKAKL